jgi:phosphomannomutase
MVKTGAIIGGESSGGLTVRGHIQGKDGIYAAALLIEMIAATKMKLSELYSRIEREYGVYEMEERDYRFSQEKKEEIKKILFHDKLLPVFPYAVKKVSYLDGCKVYFENNGWIIARFSGTEPLIRIFCEMGSAAEANAAIDIFEKFLKLG